MRSRLELSIQSQVNLRKEKETKEDEVYKLNAYIIALDKWAELGWWKRRKTPKPKLADFGF